MAYYQDLDGCDYFGREGYEALVAVGWLEDGHGYPHRDASIRSCSSAWKTSQQDRGSRPCSSVVRNAGSASTGVRSSATTCSSPTDESFCPPGSIGQPMDHVAAEIHRLKQLQAVPEADLARIVAYLCDYVNFAHPFREGNGRATRAFFDLLLSERGDGIDWEKTRRPPWRNVTHRARPTAILTLFGTSSKG